MSRALWSNKRDSSFKHIDVLKYWSTFLSSEWNKTYSSPKNPLDLFSTGSSHDLLNDALSLVSSENDAAQLAFGNNSSQCVEILQWSSCILHCKSHHRIEWLQIVRLIDAIKHPYRRVCPFVGPFAYLSIHRSRGTPPVWWQIGPLVEVLGHSTQLLDVVKLWFRNYDDYYKNVCKIM